MILKRRGLLGAIGLVMAAPVIARAENLMKISVERPLQLWGDGIHDDTAALQAMIDQAARVGGTVHLRPGLFKVTRALEVSNVSLIGSRSSVDGFLLSTLVGAPSEGAAVVRIRGEGAGLYHLRISNNDPGAAVFIPGADWA